MFNSKAEVLAIATRIVDTFGVNGNHFAFAFRASPQPGPNDRGRHIKSVVRVTRTDDGYHARTNVYVRTSGATGEVSSTERQTGRKATREVLLTFLCAELVKLSTTHPTATLDTTGPAKRGGAVVVDTTAFDALPDTAPVTVSETASKPASKPASK